MCGGVQYQDHTIYFPQPDAKLPIRLRGGGVTWVTWGRRQKEAIGNFSNGGWARLDSIKMGKWKPWHPKPVLIPIESFLEKGHDKQSQWITLAPDLSLQGLVAERNGEQRVCIVTEEAPLNVSGSIYFVKRVGVRAYLIMKCLNSMAMI